MYEGIMKGFNRQNQLFSLCGLNCGLCPMFLNKYCPGCGGGEGNQSCRIAKCSMEHTGIEYCFQWSKYPCLHYEHIDDFDSFITHLHRRADLEKAKESGIEAYNAEQIEKTEILNILLSEYNAGRQKTMFCVAVNLLDLQELRKVIKEVEKKQDDMETWTLKEKSAFVVGLLQETAAKKNIDLKLRKKKEDNASRTEQGILKKMDGSV